MALNLSELLGVGGPVMPQARAPIQTPSQILGMMDDEEAAATADPYANLYGMLPPPEMPAPAEEAPVTPQGVLPAYATATRPAMPEPIASGGYPFDTFSNLWMKGMEGGQEEPQTPQMVLDQMRQGMGPMPGMEDPNASEKEKGGANGALPGYSFMKPTSAMQKGQNFLLPMDRREASLMQAGYRKPAERSQWLRSLRVKKGYFANISALSPENSGPQTHREDSWHVRHMPEPLLPEY